MYTHMQYLFLVFISVITFYIFLQVSEQHRIKVSERTCEDEMRRRKETKPVVVIDHSKLNESVTTDSTEHIDKDVDKLTDEPKKTYVPNYVRIFSQSLY